MERSQCGIDPQRLGQGEVIGGAGDAAGLPDGDTPSDSDLPEPGEPGFQVKEFDDFRGNSFQIAMQGGSEFQASEVIDQPGAEPA